jgi:hypothetical protein
MLKAIRTASFVGIIALAAVQTNAADQFQSRIAGPQNQTQTTKGGVYQYQQVGTVNFSCGKTTCSCHTSADCFDMGTAGVCKDKIVEVKGSPSNGTCTAK